MTDPHDAHRRLLVASITGAGLLLATKDPGLVLAAETAQREKDEEKQVGAVEDLMREHGVLRRALLVYRESATKLRGDPGSIDPKALHQTAVLFRTFGEDYHERKLEEPYIFPTVRNAGGAAASYVDVLIAQHNRGREITDYVSAITAKGLIGTGDAEPLARVFEAMDLMYENHAAREDTIVFPAWKDALSARQLHEMSETFEDIEHQLFGKDGFKDAVEKIGEIEQVLGFADLDSFTAPPPPQR
jgi:hemerythrin-like domain-containing protein